jgi:hypothetical protein
MTRKSRFCKGRDEIQRQMTYRSWLVKMTWHLKPQIPLLRCGMTNQKRTKLYTNGNFALVVGGWVGFEIGLAGVEAFQFGEGLSIALPGCLADAGEGMVEKLRRE